MTIPNFTSVVIPAYSMPVLLFPEAFCCYCIICLLKSKSFLSHFIYALNFQLLNFFSFLVVLGSVGKIHDYTTEQVISVPDDEENPFFAVLSLVTLSYP